MAKVTIEKELHVNLKKCAERLGYSSVDEFIIHTLEKAVLEAGRSDPEDAVADRLKGLGYIS